MSDTAVQFREISAILGWADTPWIVAALLGAWGVMIGIEEFFLADLFIVLAGGFCTWRLVVDCFQRRKGRWIPFLLWMAVILSIIGVDIHLTAQKRRSAEARSKEIPSLRAEISTLQNTIQEQNVQLNQEEGRTDQHVVDIQRENGELKRSIERKDAALVSIAKQQYSLNFLPQIVVSVQQKPESITVQNLGKTNVTIYRLDEVGNGQLSLLDLPEQIAPGASAGFSITSERKNAILNSVQYDPVNKDRRVSDEYVVYLLAQDTKRYEMSFTWTFIADKGSITRSFATDHPIVEVR